MLDSSRGQHAVLLELTGEKKSKLEQLWHRWVLDGIK